jgi:class 3 adenylate cyclase
MSTGEVGDREPAVSHNHKPPSLARRAWCANLRQELLPPVSAIMDLADMLLRDARDRGASEFEADLQRMHTSSHRLLAMVLALLEPHPDDPGLIRHDLRNPLNGLIGFCELWLEDAPDLLLDSFIPDLREIHRLSWEVLHRVDELVRAADAEQGPGTEDVPAVIRQVVASLPAPAEDSTTSDRTTPGSLLVVDDTEINRDLLARRLRRDGHTVTLAENGRQALELLRRQSFDLVLLDVIMPELHGLQVLEQLKADSRLRNLPVIMISALDEVDSVVRCIQIGAEDYLPRPFNPVLLRARIGACLEKKRLRDREALHLTMIEQEQRRSDELLHVVLPAEIVKELKTTNVVKPRRHENVAVLFADIVGFTRYCDQQQPEALIPHLQQLNESWEASALRHDVQKIKTIGDSLMAAAGLLRPVENPVLACVRLGREMIAALEALPIRWQVRVGIHIGPVVAGVLGKRQYLFDLWGDTVNTAARMESHGVPGAITLSREAWERIADLAHGTSVGPVPIKGKGALEMIRFDGFQNTAVGGEDAK